PHALKQLFLREEAHDKIIRGAGALAGAARVMLGPKSKRVPVGNKWGRPLVCNDGVTIAKEAALVNTRLSSTGRISNFELIQRVFVLRGDKGGNSCSFNGRWRASNNDNTGRRHGVEFTILIEIETDFVIRGNLNTLIHDNPAQAGSFADSCTRKQN